MSDGKIVIELNMDDTDFNSDILKAEGKTASFGDQLKNLLATFGLLKIGSEVFNMIRDSVGSAMDRLDTMDQFERVITTMTGSSKIAKQALDDIKDAATGTAYGLDTMATSTQRFVTSGLDINKATEQTRIWGDAVAFYGDGSNDTYNSVTEALSRMVAKGKVEMDQMNRLTDAGIPALQIYADKVGKSTAEVQEDLSSGKISAVEFMDTLTLAFTDGTAKFASISGAAKEAGASWKGTFDNMRAAVTRGVESLIKNLDEGLIKAGLGSIKDNIANFGKAMENALKTVGSAIPPIIKLIKDLKPVIIGLGTAWASTKIVGGISDGVSMVKGLYGGFKDVFTLVKGDTGFSQLSTAFKLVSEEGGSATGVMGKLGDVFSTIDPVKIGLVVGIGLLTAALTLARDEAKNEEFNKLRDSLNETTESMAKMREESVKVVEEGLSEITYYENLKKELDNYVDANGNVIGSRERVSEILTSLNEGLGTELQLVGDQIEGYGELGSAIDDVIEKKKAQVLIDAYSDDYAEAVSKRTEIQTKWSEANNKFLEAEKTYNAEYAKARRNNVSESEAINDADRAVYNKHGKWWSEYVDAKQKADNNLYENEKIILNQEQALTASQEGNYAEVERIYEAHNYNIKDLSTMRVSDLKSAIAELKSLEDANIEMYNRTGEDRYKQNADNYARDREQLQTQLDTLESEVTTALPSYLDAWTKLGEGGVQGLKSSDPKMYNAALTQAQLAVDGAESKEDAYKALGDKFGQGFVDDLIATYGDARSAGAGLPSEAKEGVKSNNDSSQLGRDFGLGYANGLASLASYVFEQAKGLALTAKSGTASGQKSASPSKIARGLGEDYGEGYALGITDMISDVVKSAKKLVNAAIDETSDKEFMLSGVKIGDEIVQGIEIGLDFDVKKMDSIKNQLDKFVKDVSINTKLDTVMNAQTPVKNETNYNIELHTTLKNENSQYELMQELQALLNRMGWSKG